jgi:hypothetical protein
MFIVFLKKYKDIKKSTPTLPFYHHADKCRHSSSNADNQQQNNILRSIFAVILFVKNLKIKRNDKILIKITQNTETRIQVFAIVPYGVGSSQKNGEKIHRR